MSGPGGQSVWFRWDGFAELYAQFARLGQDMTEKATPDVEGAAHAAKNAIAAGYPTRTGDLKKELSVEVERDETRIRAIVINSSPHAVVYERGSEARHTAIGANRGSMPPNPIFTATMMRARRALLTQPIPRVITDFGMQVSGVP